MSAVTRDEMEQLYMDVDTAWIVVNGGIVFFMQAGFSMLEAGCVSSKNVINILYKNVMDGAIAAVCFWLLGYGIAFGDTAGGVLGTTNFALVDAETGQDYANFFFQWAFTGTAATIVSGSVAERMKFEMYLVFSGICSILIYPPVVHWVWGSGFLSPRALPSDDGSFNPLLKGDEQSNGVMDFGGSGVVHMLGGFSGLMGAIALGPRRGRFDAEGKPQPMPPHNTSMMALGATILWFGWYSFNSGSTLAVSHGMAQVAGKVAVNTTIAGATGALVATILSRIFEKTFDIGLAINGLLAGLVAVTAPCAVCEPWGAFLIGILAPWIYYGAHRLLLRVGVDDPLDAFPIHGCCGAFGVISVGIFCQDKYVQWAGYPHSNDACARGEQFGVQCIAVLVIASWSMVMSGLTFFGLRALVGIRVPDHVEHEGLDVSEHGGNAYFDQVPLADGGMLGSPHQRRVSAPAQGKSGSGGIALDPSGRRKLPAQIAPEPSPSDLRLPGQTAEAPAAGEEGAQARRASNQQAWVAEDLDNTSADTGTLPGPVGGPGNVGWNGVQP